MTDFAFLRPFSLPAIAALLASGAMTLAACASDDTAQKKEAPPPPPKVVSVNQDSARFSAAAETFFTEYVQMNPTLGVELGLHEYDGVVPDVSASALAAHLAAAKRFEQAFSAYDPVHLTPRQRVERDAVLSLMRTDIFELEERRSPQRNPIMYSIGLSEYISRPYAPLAERAAAIVKVCAAAPKFFADAQANLDEVLPRTYVKTALAQTTGTADFVRGDVKLAMSELKEPQKGELFAALDALALVLDAHAKFLEGRLASADDNYALGEAKFMKMLHVQNDMSIDLATLKKVAEADLARNTAAIVAAAKEIDPNAPPADVIARVLNDKPAKDAVLQEARNQLVTLRQHLIDHDVVTIPTDDVAEVVVTPPFLRYNFAFLDGAGMFEKKKLPSFYYITPPDPKWPEAKQAAYVPGKTDLLGTSIHEVWPGHFLHALHKKQNDSKILKSFWNYAMGEGWAHYVEEMMITDAGYGKNAPDYRIGMLINALLRNVRFLSAIGLHCEGMSVAESEALFAAKAFQDAGNAGQQASRGTFDPMYLSYTLGKLMIKKLKHDLQGRDPKMSDKAFHDAFLAFGAAPVPSIRRAMLGDDSPAL